MKVPNSEMFWIDEATVIQIGSYFMYFTVGNQ